MILAIALNAAVLLEQPHNSFIPYYPRFRDFITMLEEVGGRSCAARLFDPSSSWQNHQRFQRPYLARSTCATGFLWDQPDNQWMS